MLKQILITVTITALIWMAGPSVLAGVPQTIKPANGDLGSGAANSVGCWYPGGIGGTWLAVGNPNELNRNDRVIIRFDISPFIVKGRIRQAVLKFKMEPFTKGETFQLEHFTVERVALSGNDLISTATEAVKDFTVRTGTPSGTELAFVVTALVNRDLSIGFGGSTFRLKSLTVEKVGNPENKPSGISVVKDSIRLEIME